MTRELHWRILTLQIIGILVLAFAASVGFWASSYTHDQVTSQLKEQQIVFPPATSAEIKALPATQAAAMKQYAGQQMTTGYQARTWAEDFIAVHLKTIGQGKTYSYWSGKAMAETNPTLKARDDGIAQTLFRGESLRAMLNQAYAFWFIGDIAFYAALGFVVGGLLIFLAFLFELLVVPKREGIVELRKVAERIAVPTA